MSAFLLVFLIAKIAAADSSNYCAALLPLRQSMHFCWQNSFFETAADQCLNKFLRDLASEKNKLAQNFQTNQNQSRSAQDSKMQNSSINLNQTDSSLKSLLAKGAKAKAEFEAYQRAMIFPGNPSESFVQAMGLRSHLSEFSCFHDPHSAIGEKIIALIQKMKELQAADNSANLLRRQTSANQTNLQQLGGSTQVPSLAPRIAPGLAPKIPSENGKGIGPKSSTISGQTDPLKKAKK